MGAQLGGRPLKSSVNEKDVLWCAKAPQQDKLWKDQGLVVSKDSFPKVSLSQARMVQ